MLSSINIMVRFISISLGLLVVQNQAYASKRTVSFSGVAVVESEGLDAGSNISTCVISISNLTSREQVIESVYFYLMDQSTGKVSSTSFTPSTSSSGISSVYHSTSSTASACSSALSQNSTCVIQAKFYSFMHNYYLPVCVGKITVEDSSSGTSPGAVIASGAIRVSQESVVVGGVLSGAMYVSSPKIEKSDFSSSSSGVYVDSTSLSSSYYDNYCSNNMNIYCAYACYNTKNTGSPWDIRTCMEHCGCRGTSIKDNTSSPRNHEQDGGKFDRNVVGFIEPVANPNAKTASVAVDTTASVHQVIVNPGTSGDEDKMGVSTEQYPFNMAFMNRSANPAYSGGMVQEVIIGPMKSVCSGNAAFFGEGSDDFYHYGTPNRFANSPGTWSTFATTPTATTYKERLFCYHRHGRNELTMRVGQSIPFTINGGMPF